MQLLFLSGENGVTYVNLRVAGLITAVAAAILAVATPRAAASTPAPSACGAPSQAGVASALFEVISSTSHPSSSVVDYQTELSVFQADLACAREQGDLELQAGNLGSIGVIDRQVGRYTEALFYDRQALAIDEKLKNPDSEAYEYLAIGDTESALALYQDALRDYQKAIELFGTGDPGAASLALNGMAVVTERETENGENGATYTAALQLVDQSDAMRGQPAAQTLASRGLIESRLGNDAQALEAFDELLEYTRSAHDDATQAAALTSIASVEVRQRSYADALSASLAAVKLAQALGLPQWQALSVAAGAESNFAGKDAANKATSYYDSAIADIERLRSDISENENASARTAFFSSTLSVYDSYITYLLELDRRYPGQGYDKKALEVFERREGRAFFEEISKSAARTFAGASPDLVKQENELAANVTLLQAQLLHATPGPDADALRNGAAQAQKTLTSFEDSLRVAAPAYYSLLHPQTLRSKCSSSECLSLDEYEHNVLHADEAVLVYDVMQNRTALWVVTHGTMRLFTIPYGEKELQAKLDAAAPTSCYAQSFRGLLDAVHEKLGTTAIKRIAQANLGPCEAAGAALYATLVPAGAAAMTSSASTLFFVPTGPLYGVALEALVTQPPVAGSPPVYLIEEKAVAYLSSASLLNILRSGVEKRNVTGANPLVAFADPDYTDSGGNFPELPGSDGEATATFAALGTSPTQATLYERERATRQNVETLNSSKQLGVYRYVLFGTHAVLPNQITGLTQPSIVLAHPLTSDDYLTMADVFGLSLDANAVVLSACDSGSGESVGDSVEGLTQAFMYAGTPIVAVTNWEVVDQIQEELTPQFFAQMAAGKTPAGALQSAKVALIRSSDATQSHPFFWAPMVIFGDGDVKQ